MLGILPLYTTKSLECTNFTLLCSASLPRKLKSAKLLDCKYCRRIPVTSSEDDDQAQGSVSVGSIGKMEGQDGFGVTGLFKSPPAFQISDDFLDRTFVMKNDKDEVVAQSVRIGWSNLMPSIDVVL